MRLARARWRRRDGRVHSRGWGPGTGRTRRRAAGAHRGFLEGRQGSPRLAGISDPIHEARSGKLRLRAVRCGRRGRLCGGCRGKGRLCGGAPAGDGRFPGPRAPCRATPPGNASRRRTGSGAKECCRARLPARREPRRADVLPAARRSGAGAARACAPRRRATRPGRRGSRATGAARKLLFNPLHACILRPQRFRRLPTTLLEGEAWVSVSSASSIPASATPRKTSCHRLPPSLPPRRPPRRRRPPRPWREQAPRPIRSHAPATPARGRQGRPAGLLPCAAGCH